LTVGTAQAWALGIYLVGAVSAAYQYPSSSDAAQYPLNRVIVRTILLFVFWPILTAISFWRSREEVKQILRRLIRGRS
jgi:hypothetical protein